MSENRSEDRIEQWSSAGPFAPREILGRLISVGESRVLDVGSGSGFWTLEAARLGAKEVIAVERNAERVASLAKKASDLGLGNVQPLQGWAERLPVDTQSCDLAVASLVLHEVNDLPAALAELRRVLREGGKLVVVELLPGDHPHHPRIGVGYLQALLEAEGFEAEHLEEQGGWYSLVLRRGGKK